MIGHRVYPMHMQYSSKEYDCDVTFLKVSDIRVPLQSRSFPAAGSPPGSGALPKRLLKLTTLYGTGQQTIGEFQISGNECNIQQRRTYKFVSTDSVSVTKLHIYVDEDFNAGLTGHVTIDLKEFMGEDDSEIHIEYPLSVSTPRHRAATLHVVVQCKGPPEVDDDVDDVLDMDLETFLYDEYPESFLEFSDNKEFEVSEHFLHPAAGSVGESNLDALGQREAPGCGPFSEARLDEFQTKIGENKEDALGQQPGCHGARSQVPSPKEFEGDFLGLDTILKDFVAEYSQTRPFLVTGGQYRKKAMDRKDPTKSHLYAAVFFAAGVTMQQRLQPLEANSEMMSGSVDYGVSPKTSSSRMILRSESDEFDIKRVLSPRIPNPEVIVTVREEATRNSGVGFNEALFSDCCSPSPSYREIESVQSSANEAKLERGRSYVQSHTDFVVSPTCSTAESTIQDQNIHGNDLEGLDADVDDVLDSPKASTSAADEETKPLISPVSSSKQLKRSVLVVVRNIVGILLIAGVSFVLGVGAHEAGLLGTTWKTSPDEPGAASKWSAESIHQQMGPWKATDEATDVAQMRKVPALSRPFLASKIGLPTQQLILLEGHRKIAAGMSSDSASKRRIDMIFQDSKSEVLSMDDSKEGDSTNPRIERLAGRQLMGWPALSIDAEMRSGQQGNTYELRTSMLSESS